MWSEAGRIGGRGADARRPSATTSPQGADAARDFMSSTSFWSEHKLHRSRERVYGKPLGRYGRQGHSFHMHGVVASSGDIPGRNFPARLLQDYLSYTLSSTYHTSSRPLFPTRYAETMQSGLAIAKWGKMWASPACRIPTPREPVPNKARLSFPGQREDAHPQPRPSLNGRLGHRTLARKDEPGHLHPHESRPP